MAIISEELNVKSVVTSSDETALVQLSAKANFKTLGPKLGATVKAYAAAISEIDTEQLEALLDTGSMTLDGLELTVDDVVMSRDPRPGVAVASQGQLSVALDIELTDELRAEGMARDVVSNVQQLRRDLDLAVVDRIVLRWHTADEALADAVQRHSGFIASEVLATKLTRGSEPEGSVATIGDASITLAVQKK